MERYVNCTDLQKKILDRIFVYLGFNEVTSFEDYIKFIFYNAKEFVTFDHILNHTLAHIVSSFEDDYPMYAGKYIKYNWLSSEEILEHLKVGTNIEYDSKGLLRHYVLHNYKKLMSTKL